MPRLISQALWCTPFLLQGVAILVDEFYFHHRRRLGRWERWGHPLDTLSLLICLLIARFMPLTPTTGAVFTIASVFTCLFITKDEWIHAQECPGTELWLHSLLFVLHPLALAATAVLWLATTPAPPRLGLANLALPAADFAFGALNGQLVILTLFGIYQTVYWNFCLAHPNAATGVDSGATAPPRENL